MPSSQSGPLTPWTPPSVEDLDRLLPQYEIDAMLGRGGMGAVYQGHQASLGRKVAIKVLPEHLIAGDSDDNHQYVERFKLEARSMANLDHPAIISVYDFGQTEAGHLYFVMEFIDGMDIEQYIQANGGSVDAEHAIAIVSHVLDALDYAHSKGIIHRDIKPANVLLNRDGRVKIADFGLAKAFGDSAEGDEGAMLTGLTMTNVAMGTPDYIAPEAMDEGVVPDHRADLYAVGVMLYRMLTGKLPRGIFKLPSEENAELDPRFDELITHGMAGNPDERFQSASEFRSKLGEMLSQPVTRIEPGQDSGAVKAPVTGSRLNFPAPGGQPQSEALPPSRSAALSKGGPVAKKSPAAAIGAVVAVCLIIGLVVYFLVFKDPTGSSEGESDGVADSSAGDPSVANANTDGDGEPEAKMAMTPSADPGAPSETRIAQTLPPKPAVPKVTANPSPKPPAVSVSEKPEALPDPELQASLVVPDIPDLQTRLGNYRKARQQQIGALVDGYRGALNREKESATAGGDLDDVEQSDRALAALGGFAPQIDAVLAASQVLPLPATPEPTQRLFGEVAKLEGLFYERLATTEAELQGKLEQSLQGSETALKRDNQSDEARQVADFRSALMASLALPDSAGKDGAAPSATVPAEAIDLMNLAEWEINGTAKWRMQGAAFVSDTAARGHLYRSVPYDEFAIEGEIFWDAEANGGVGFLGAEFDRSNVQTGGYEFQISGSKNSHRTKTGSLLTNGGVVALDSNLVPDGQWTPFQIRVTRQFLQGWLDGREVFNSPLLSVTQRQIGNVINLQQWGNGGTVGYRDLKLTPIGVAAAAPISAELPDDAGWTVFFDGNDLGDWQVNAGGNWSVEEGAIWKRGGEPGIIYKTVPFAETEFEFEGEFRTSADGNGGVIVDRIAELALVGSKGSGFGGVWTGGVFAAGVNRSLASPDSNSIKDDTWTSFRMRWHGGRFQTWVDGKQIAAVEIAGAVSKPRIGLQGRMSGEVAYRNLRIRPLAP